MQHLLDALIEPLTGIHFQKALIGATLSAIACGVIGSFIVLRRMAFLGDALSHAMLAGVTSGYLFMQMLFGYEAHAPAMIIGALLAGLVTVSAISFVSQVSRIKEDTAIGIMYTGIFALGGILASVFSDRIHIHLFDFIVGMVLAVEDGHLWMIASVCVLVLCVVILFFRQLQITTFDPIMAASIGVPVVGVHYLLTACTSLVVVSAVPVVGVVLVVGLLITPAASAYLVTNRLRTMVIAAPIFGVFNVVVGLYLSSWIGNVAPGPMIVVVGTIQFIILLCIAPRYGLIADWWRRRQLVPQALLEDILGLIRHDGRQQVPLHDILVQVKSPQHLVRRAVRELQRQHFLKEDGQGVGFTEVGQHEARRLLRSHRLWETYLQHVGTPEAELHPTAHQLEHLHDENTVDYLDDKLGHPLQDPHGSEIPEDFIDLVPGARIKASLLRQGHQATVISVSSGWEDHPIQKETQITAGPRRDEGNIWTFFLPDGSLIELDHEAADAVTVRLDNTPES